MKELRKKYPGSQYSEYNESPISLLWLAYMSYLWSQMKRSQTMKNANRQKRQKPNLNAMAVARKI